MLNYKLQLISQQTELQDPEWQYRGCGIAALKMVMNYWHALSEVNVSPPIDELLAAGLKLNAYVQNIGWSHAGLTNVAKQCGYDGKNYDLADSNADTAWKSLMKQLKNGPVMASVYSQFDPTLGGGHIVVLTGIDDNTVYLNDPEEASQEAGTKTMELNDFLKAWKKRYIVISPDDRGYSVLKRR